MSDLFTVEAELEYDADTDQLLRAGAATCEIVDAFPAAQKIIAGQLREGDRLFDAFGGTHEIESVRRSRGWVYTVRHDGWDDRFHQSETITIVRPTQEV